MRVLPAFIAVSGLLIAGLGTGMDDLHPFPDGVASGGALPGGPVPWAGDLPPLHSAGLTLRASRSMQSAEFAQVIRHYCVQCHNERLVTGNLSLAGLDLAQASATPDLAEKIISKLRTEMMPPPGMPRPRGDTLLAMVETLETLVDEAAAENPSPGSRAFQRLNRAEYQASIRSLLNLDVDAGNYLPLDTRAANFDNMADAQLLSPTLLDAYLKAAAEISRLAVGDPGAPLQEQTYTNPGYLSQMDHIPGAPFGTRGGISVVHTFPADGEYVFRIGFEHTTTGEGFFGQIARYEQLEVSINGVPVALLDVDQWMRGSDPEGISMRTDPIQVKAGPQRISAAFLRRADGPVEDLLSPHDWSLADRHTGISGYGLTLLPHVRDLIIGGPYTVTGISETPSRQAIFSCRPSKERPGEACAREILERLAGEAYRRPLEPRDVEALLQFYRQGESEGGFELGIRTGLQAILASPHFVFRLERAPAGVRPGEVYPIPDGALASRLSFFLWGAPPDEELRELAARGRLGEPEVLEAQTRRMLADPRAEALATRFAAQWLRLQDLDRVHPDAFWFPDFDQQLREAMRRETELLFHHLVQEDRSLMELYTADYTFVNERLARHYGIPGVNGTTFRRADIPDPARRGLLGHGSVLVSTSVANRTSPVLRGKWVMEVLLGSPPPPPPPGVPDLNETEEAVEGKFLTTRERMEQHRANPACTSCHMFMDPIGLALENFDVTGRWRIRENGMPLDTRGDFYDGTPVQTPGDLREALLKRPIPLVRTFTENLMAYALGRPVEARDQPTVRAIAASAGEADHRMSAFILGVVGSDAFRMQREEVSAEEQGDDRN